MKDKASISLVMLSFMLATTACLTVSVIDLKTKLAYDCFLGADTVADTSDAVREGVAASYGRMLLLGSFICFNSCSNMEVKDAWRLVTS